MGNFGGGVRMDEKRGEQQQGGGLKQTFDVRGFQRSDNQLRFALPPNVRQLLFGKIG